MDDLPTTASNTPAPDPIRTARNLTMIIYVLYAVSYLVGITALIAIIINYVKRDDVAGTFMESHFRWQIRSFWFGLLWFVIGGILAIVLVGWAIIFATWVWLVYRVVKGILYLNDGKPMYPPAA